MTPPNPQQKLQQLFLALTGGASAGPLDFYRAAAEDDKTAMEKIVGDFNAAEDVFAFIEDYAKDALLFTATARKNLTALQESYIFSGNMHAALFDANLIADSQQKLAPLEAALGETAGRFLAIQRLREISEKINFAGEAARVLGQVIADTAVLSSAFEKTFRDLVRHIAAGHELLRGLGTDYQPGQVYPDETIEENCREYKTNLAEKLEELLDFALKAGTLGASLAEMETVSSDRLDTASQLALDTAAIEALLPQIRNLERLAKMTAPEVRAEKALDIMNRGVSIAGTPTDPLTVKRIKRPGADK